MELLPEQMALSSCQCLGAPFLDEDNDFWPGPGGRRGLAISDLFWHSSGHHFGRFSAKAEWAMRAGYYR